MRALLVVLSLWAVGCVTIPVEVAKAVERHVDEDEQARLQSLRDQSRARLYPPGGPRCSVNVDLTGPRTWKLSSCDGELKCWALSDGYDCEPGEKQPASAPL